MLENYREPRGAWGCPWAAAVELAYSGQSKAFKDIITDENVCRPSGTSWTQTSWNELQNSLLEKSQSTFCSTEGKNISNKMNAACKRPAQRQRGKPLVSSKGPRANVPQSPQSRSNVQRTSQRRPRVIAQRDRRDERDRCWQVLKRVQIPELPPKTVAACKLYDGWEHKYVNKLYDSSMWEEIHPTSTRSSTRSSPNQPTDPKWALIDPAAVKPGNR